MRAGDKTLANFILPKCIADQARASLVLPCAQLQLIASNISQQSQPITMHSVQQPQ